MYVYICYLYNLSISYFHKASQTHKILSKTTQIKDISISYTYMVCMCVFSCFWQEILLNWCYDGEWMNDYSLDYHLRTQISWNRTHANLMKIITLLCTRLYFSFVHELDWMCTQDGKKVKVINICTYVLHSQSHVQMDQQQKYTHI